MSSPVLKVLAIGNASAAAFGRSEYMSIVGAVPVDMTIDAGGDGDWTLPDLVHLYDNLDVALKESGAQAAVIYVPNTAKNPVDLECRVLLKGIPVICSKLRLQNWSDAEKLVSAAITGSTAYYCGDHFRYSSNVETLKAELPKIGSLMAINWSCKLSGDWQPWMRSYTHLALEDLAYHHLSVMLYLAGCDFQKLTVATFDPRPVASGPISSARLEGVSKAGWKLTYDQQWGGELADTTWLGDIEFIGQHGRLRLRQETIELESINGMVEILKDRQIPVAHSFTDHIVAVLLRNLTPAGHPLSLKEFQPVCRLIDSGWRQNMYKR